MGILPCFNPIALRKAKFAYNFDSSECIRVKASFLKGDDLTLKALITTAADDIHKYFFRENKTCCFM